jgi:hypothetical protein
MGGSLTGKLVKPTKINFSHACNFACAQFSAIDREAYKRTAQAMILREVNPALLREMAPG